MTLTAGEVSDKIQEIKSKLLVYKTLVEVINANYMPCDSGAPEIVLRRTDGGAVTEAHMESVLKEIEAKSSDLREELAEWQGLVFESAPAVRPVRVVEQETAKKAVVEKAKTSGRRLQPAPPSSRS